VVTVAAEHTPPLAPELPAPAQPYRLAGSLGQFNETDGNAAFTELG